MGVLTPPPKKKKVEFWQGIGLLPYYSLKKFGMAVVHLTRGTLVHTSAENGKKQHKKNGTLAPIFFVGGA